MKLGLQGHSILFASGDYGVASFPADGDADGCRGPEGTIFNPQYPSNCPYVTSVGGTQLYGDQTVLDQESVMHVNLSGTAQNFSSAGGFSNYFGQPDYQKNAVAEYFKIADLTYPYYSEFEVDFNTTKGIYNRIGRGYPDVAANGAQYRAFEGGVDYHWYGSSLASPLFASVLTLVSYTLRSLQDPSRHVADLVFLAQRRTLCYWQRTYWFRQPSFVRQSLGSERYHERDQCRMWFRGLSCCQGMGSIDRARDAKLSQDVGVLLVTTMRGSMGFVETGAKS